MKKIYLLETAIEDKNGVLFPVRYNEKFIDANYYEQYITYKEIKTKKLNIFLIIDPWESSKPILRDFHTWGIGRPNAYTIVCSPKLKSILETLNLPPHRFYTAEIDVLGEVHNYYVLHFIHEYLQLMIYEQSQFCRAEILETKPILQTYKTGEISDYEHYNNINTKLIDDMQWLFPRRIIFPTDKSYDVWGLQGGIILSEKAKQKIAEAAITGVDMPELDNHIQIAISNNSPTSKPTVYIPNDKISIVAEPKSGYKK